MPHNHWQLGLLQDARPPSRRNSLLSSLRVVLLVDLPSSKPVWAAACYVDGVPHTKRDGVIGFFIYSLVTQRSHSRVAVRKSDWCRSGCRGWCSVWIVRGSWLGAGHHCLQANLPPGWTGDEGNDHRFQTAIQRGLSQQWASQDGATMTTHAHCARARKTVYPTACSLASTAPRLSALQRANAQAPETFHNFRSPSTRHGGRGALPRSSISSCTWSSGLRRCSLLGCTVSVFRTGSNRKRHGMCK